MRTDIVVPFCVHAIAVSTVITVVNIRFANCMGKTTLGPSLGSIPSIPVNIQKSSGDWPYLIAAHQFILNLKDYPNFSVVIPIVTNKTEASFSELLNELLRARQIGRSFHVKAPSGYRVMATIQELKLNDPDIFVAQAKEDSCMENYLQFGDNMDDVSQRICGSVDATNSDQKPARLIGPRTYRSSHETLSVTFQLGEAKRYYGPWYSGEPQYKLAIAFTAFMSQKDVELSETSIRSAMYPCTFGETVDNDTYIPSDLFCDGVFNCGSKETFGLDEHTAYCDFLQTLSLGSQMSKDDDSSDQLQKKEMETATAANKNLPLNPVNTPNHDSPETPDTTSTRYYESFGPHPSLIYPSDDNTDYTTQYQPQLSAPTTIILIVLIIIIVLFLGMIIRFCCTRCVGKPLPVPSSFSPGLDSSGLTLVTVDAALVPHQCSRDNLETDLPPSYEELFPTWKLNLNNINVNSNCRVNPAYEEEIDMSPCATATTQNSNVMPVKNITSD